MKTEYIVGQTMNLLGFTSTSLIKSRAIDFALEGYTKEVAENKTPILLEIEITGSNQFFSLNTNEYSSYPSEAEVLLQEGIKYKVVGVENIEQQKKFRCMSDGINDV